MQVVALCIYILLDNNLEQERAHTRTDKRYFFLSTVLNISPEGHYILDVGSMLVRISL